MAIPTRIGRMSSLALILAGIGLGYLGSVVAPSVTARADVTEEPRREAFQPGDVVNQPLLREIAATLKRIEEHVERIEKRLPADENRPAVKAKTPNRR